MLNQNKMKPRDDSKFVSLDMPAIQHDGKTRGPLKMLLLKTDDPRAAVQVELNVENLECIRAAFRNETIVKSKERPKPAYDSDKSVKWSCKRSAFIA